MKKPVLVIAYCIISFLQGRAQEIEWQNTIGGNGMDRLYTMIRTNDGGFMCAGVSGSGISGDKTETTRGIYDYWIVKLDSSGNKQFDKRYGGSDWDDLTSVQQTTDGGYILGGYSQSEDGGVSDKTEGCIGLGIYPDYWIIKIDSVGNIQWQNTIGGNNYDELNAVLQTADGGYIVGGYSNSFYSGDKTSGLYGGYDFWILKLDSVGNIIWQRDIGGNGHDALTDLKQTLDGGYVAVGVSSSNVSGDKTENSNGFEDYWIIKIDSVGTILWQNTLGGDWYDNPTNVQLTTDGGYIIGGYSNSSASGDKTENNVGMGGSNDYWIVKVDSLGNKQWDKTLGGSGNEWFSNVTQIHDGGYLIAGPSSSLISGNKSENNYGSEDCWVIKTDSIGNLLWENTIGGIYEDGFSSVLTVSPGKYICGGYSHSPVSGDQTESCFDYQGGDYWVVKLTDNYNLITGKMFLDFNLNQAQDAGEPPLIQNKIMEQASGKWRFSNSNGSYVINVLDTGSFTVVPIPINYYNAAPVSHTAYFNGMQQTDSLNDFAFQPTGVYNDLCVTITPLGNFRSGFNASYMINYGNYGTTALNGDIIFLTDTNVSFSSANVVPALITQDSVVWNLGVLSPYQTGSILITVSVDAGVPIGTLINSHVRIDPVAGDANPTCNYDNWEVYTTGSNDPNDMVVSDESLTTTQLAAKPFLDYLIRFQNTGNDTAFIVKVLNPIDTNKLDLSTFELVNASHPVNLNWINYQRNMEFKWENILLPDSNINELASHGFIHYRIKPKTTLTAGDSITNNAYIYFDFNTPVATNIAVTYIVLPTVLSSLHTGNSQMILFPNPANNEINITLNVQAGEKPDNICVFDMFGKKVFESRIFIHDSSTTPDVKINTSRFSPGIYFIEMQSRDTVYRGKFVKE